MPTDSAPPVAETPTPTPPPAAPLVAIPKRYAEISARADEGVDFASYLKPKGDVASSAPRDLAPLMAFRVGKEKEKTPPERLPYAVHATKSGSDSEDAPPTLYYITDKDKIGNDSLTRTSFVWFLRDDELEIIVDSAARPLPFVAVSLTLDKRGTPVIVRVRQSNSKIDRYFVAESVEAAARKEHGAPLKDRRYSIERAVTAAANASSDSGPRESLVPRLMFTVPEPTGPWVYVDFTDGFVTTVHCRCSASQIRAFTETVEYDLRPLADVPGWVEVPDLSDPTSNALRLPTVIP